MVKEARGLTLSEWAVKDLKPAVLVKAIQQSFSNILLAPDRKEATKEDVVLKLLNRLDGQRKTVREGVGNVVQLSEIIDNATGLNDLKIDDLEQVVKEIIDEFGQSLKVEYPESFLQWLTSFKGMVTVAGVLAGGAAVLLVGGIAGLGTAGYAAATEAAAGSAPMYLLTAAAETAAAGAVGASAGVAGGAMGAAGAGVAGGAMGAAGAGVAGGAMGAAGAGVAGGAMGAAGAGVAGGAMGAAGAGAFAGAAGTAAVAAAAAAWYFRKKEQNYQAILRMLVKELPEVPSEQEDSDNADDVYNLERTLYKKYKALDFLNKDVDGIMETKPFKASKMLKDAKEVSQKEALRRCQMACDLFEIRQQLQKSCFVGLFGPQNAGKSTLIQKVWGLAVPERGYRAHTTVPSLYKARGTKKMVIMDFPGTTAIDEQVANLANSCGGLSSVLILVMPFQGDTSTDHIKQLAQARTLADAYNCCVLLCISQCGRFKDILKDGKTVAAYREDYIQNLNIEPADILFTELVESIDDLESRGIVGPDGVRSWLKDWLIKYDVFKEGEDQLYAAVNMTKA
ncbi:uncharacterized protein LOC144886674 [Branchiostoma floridae x Branchiostoma japonicum]